MTHRYHNPMQRWPQRDGYRAVERIADVALLPADEVPDTPVEWLWPGVIPVGHLTLVAGEPASGKSFLMTDLAARVSFFRGWPYRNRQTPCDEIKNHKSQIQNRSNASVLYVNSDDAFFDIQQPRLADAHAQLPMVGLMRRLPPGSRYSQINSVGPVSDRLQAIKDAIQEAGDCKLAIVDDLANFVRNGLGDVTWADLTLALGRLKCMAAECNVAIVVVWRLERTGRASARQLESLLQSAAMAWLVGNDPYGREERYVVSLRNHFGLPPEPMAFHIADNRVVWDEPPDSVPADVMGAFVRKPDRRLEREQAGRWALERLAEGPVEANTLFDDAAAFGFSRRTVRRALVDLGLKPSKSGNDGPWCWGLGNRGQGTGDREQTESDRQVGLGAVVDEQQPEDGLPRPSSDREEAVTASTGAHDIPATAFEDGQVAPGNFAESDAADGTGTVPAALPEISDCGAGTTEPETVEDGHLAPEEEMELLAELAELEKNGVSGEGEKTVMVLLHRNAPGAALTFEDSQPAVLDSQCNTSGSRAPPTPPIQHPGPES